MDWRKPGKALSGPCGRGSRLKALEKYKKDNRKRYGKQDSRPQQGNGS